MFVSMLAGLAIGVAPPVAKAPPSPVATIALARPTEAAIQEAIRFLDSQDFDKIARKSAEISVEAHLVVVRQRYAAEIESGELPDGFMDAMIPFVRKTIMDKMDAEFPAMKRQSGELYATAFTVEELTHLRQVNSDPVVTKGGIYSRHSRRGLP